jgi:hypothetical protein
MKPRRLTINPSINFLVAIMLLAPALSYIFADTLGICWTEIYVGPIIAFYMIITNYFFSPKKQILSAMITLFAGSVLTLIAIMDFYPECHQLAYQHTSLAQFATISTGVLAFVFVYCVHVYKNRNHNKALKPPSSCAGKQVNDDSHRNVL